MADLKSILGTRVNVAASVYEMYGGIKLRYGGFYVIGNGYILSLDNYEYKLTDEYSEFHWSGNNLELIK
jgi:hypothetical protein